jgi:hypothetical protein
MANPTWSVTVTAPQVVEAALTTDIAWVYVLVGPERVRVVVCPLIVRVSVTKSD